MEARIIHIFRYNELSQEAKKVALEKHRYDQVEYNWWEDDYYNAKQCGVRITGFDLDRRKSIDGEFIWSEIEVAEKIEDEYSDCTDIHKIASNFLKERLRICDSYEFIDGAPIKEDELEAELNELEYQFQKDILGEFWKYLQDQYEYLLSDECVTDYLENNWHYFTENGKDFNN